MFSKNNSQLRDFYKQLPFGVAVEDYSAVKLGVDKLRAEGVKDLGQYLNDNPEVLLYLIREIQTIDANEAMLKLFKVATVQQYIDLSLDFEHWADTVGWKEYYTQEIISLAAGKPHIGEYSDLTADGTTIMYSCTSWVPPDFADDWSVLVTTHEDITERKKMERERQGSHEELERRIDERTQALTLEVIERKRAEEKAMVSSRVKSNLLSNMSHELRTPLNAIIGFSSTMQNETFGSIGNDKYREYLDDINSSGQHLLELINDILDFSAYEEGALELNETSVDMFEVVEAMIRMIQPRVERREVTVTSFVMPKIQIYADERRVKQVLLNLLSNAVKFTPEGGKVIVDAMLSDDGSFSIFVSDTGYGMNDEETTIALSRFGQVDSGHDRKYEGTGLGLPLTKGLMELHGGTLEIDSLEGYGTMVTATFPKERAVKSVS